MRTAIVDFLKKTNGYISGEEISRQLRMSRSAVWKYIQELRNEGYDIAAVPHLGYTLCSVPDVLLPREIQFGLGTRNLGKDIRSFDMISSTMEVAFRLGVEGAEEGTVICAEHQTKGKGRLGRSWVSPKGKGIYMSVLLRPPLAPVDAARLTLLSAVALCEAIHRKSSLPVQIKWPNDILVGSRKLAGILTELSAEMDRVRFIVIGIGVNVNTPTSQLPSGATSIKQETGKKVSRVALVQEILRSMEFWYDCLQKEGFKPVIDRWKTLSSTLGKTIRVVDPGGAVEGMAVDLDEYGGIIIQNKDGIQVKRMTGDVIPVGGSL